MPVSPAMAEDLAREVSLLYQDAEAALLEKLAAALAADIESPQWAELKLAALGNLRNAVEEIARALETDTNGAVRRALIEAYGRGRQAAVAELGALDIGRELAARTALPNAPSVDRLAASMADDTRPVYARITRAVTDTYRRITATAASTQLLTGITRRQASQRALDAFARRGITGFVDSAGRGWDMASYAEMAMRSVTARAAVEGHTDALAQLGVGLVIVSDAPLECERCAPWEGEVLTLSGPGGPQTIRAPHAAPTERRLLRRTPTVVVHVAGSLLEARAAGLMHPNCRHSLAAYFPGVTTRPPHHPTPGTTYADTQRQREIERHIRHWKRRTSVAMDDKTRGRAQAKVRYWQTQMREHVAAHDDLRRKPEREQIQTAAPTQAADRTGPEQPADEDQGIPSDRTAALATDLVTGADPETPAGSAMAGALAAIDRVHTIPPGMRPIPLEAETRPGYQGAYTGRRITLNPDGQAPALTAAHELGHFLDHAGLGPGGQAFFTDEAIRPGGPLHAWWTAVQDSEQAGMLDFLRTLDNGSPLVDRVRADGTRYTLDVDHQYIDYLASPREAFGRAYAQWIALRSGDRRLLSALEVARDPANGEQVIAGTGLVDGYPRYWEPDDFAPIADALDAAFRRLGLLREAP
ncbi:phage minor capsid protein [Streptomyces sp. NPDC047315]|uniref:phage minor capsid protein n=1 Tax=Streptomyces sp. NPDC047315 TaxID=3155142 RepID=UPI00340ECD32